MLQQKLHQVKFRLEAQVDRLDENLQTALLRLLHCLIVAVQKVNDLLAGQKGLFGVGENLQCFDQSLDHLAAAYFTRNVQQCSAQITRTTDIKLRQRFVVFNFG